jgi:hypothetical protein
MKNKFLIIIDIVDDNSNAAYVKLSKALNRYEIYSAIYDQNSNHLRLPKGAFQYAGEKSAPEIKEIIEEELAWMSDHGSYIIASYSRIEPVNLFPASSSYLEE